MVMIETRGSQKVLVNWLSYLDSCCDPGQGIENMMPGKGNITHSQKAIHRNI